MLAGKTVKRVSIIIISVIGTIILALAAYFLYVIFQFYRIDDSVDLEVLNNTQEQMVKGRAYTVTTYNIGFGAYDQEYSFFMDTGVMDDGTPVSGKYGKAVSKDNAMKNTLGAHEEIKKLNSDIVFLQEVDEKASRSYKINQRQIFEGTPGYAGVYAENFHSAYLAYPLSDPIGKTSAGILTLSKFKIDSSVRRSFPVDLSFPAKFFDLDRCFSISYIGAGEKTVALINLHMSAYDEGGLIRASQLEMLNTVMAAEIAKGNYVIAGGDFNHDIAGTDMKFPSKQKHPDWVAILDENDLTDGVKIAADSLVPSCRGADIPYEKGVNYTVSIDGFIVSDNIKIVSVETLNHEFLYSDHQPVTLTFILN